MNNIPPTLNHQISNSNSYSGMLSCILNDIFTKLGSITIQSVSEQVIRVWVIASSGVRRDGRNNHNAEARGLRAEGRVCGTISENSLGVQTRGCFCYNIDTTQKHPEQRARRWRAACPLIVYEGTSVDTAETYITLEWSAKAPEKLYI